MNEEMRNVRTACIELGINKDQIGFTSQLDIPHLLFYNLNDGQKDVLTFVKNSSGLTTLYHEQGDRSLFILTPMSEIEVKIIVSKIQAQKEAMKSLN